MKTEAWHIPKFRLFFVQDEVGLWVLGDEGLRLPTAAERVILEA